MYVRSDYDTLSHLREQTRGLMYSSPMRNSVSTAVTVKPARSLRGHLEVPGDKSISHRYAILASLAEGTSTIAGYSTGADCLATLDCLRALGVTIEHETANNNTELTVTVHGLGLGVFKPPTRQLDAGNSGTTMRLLAGVLAAHSFETIVTGDASLRRRPMGRVIEPLQRMGAILKSFDGLPPLTIRGARLQGIDYTPPVPSAQVKSSVLLAGLHASGSTRIRELTQTRDHTERALTAFGVDVYGDDDVITITGGTNLQATNLSVPGDPSAAAAWAVGATALPGSDVEINGVGLNPTRTAFLEVLRRAGANIDLQVSGTLGGEPVGTVRVRHRDLLPIVITPAEVPSLIDELPLLAALAAHGTSMEVSGAGELRHKESDRISMLATGLRQLGATVEERADGIRVEQKGPLTGGTTDAFGDHRLAMALTIAALGARNSSVITGSEAVNVSYPGFFTALDSLRH